MSYHTACVKNTSPYSYYILIYHNLGVTILTGCDAAPHHHCCVCSSIVWTRALCQRTAPSRKGSSSPLRSPTKMYARARPPLAPSTSTFVSGAAAAAAAVCSRRTARDGALSARCKTRPKDPLPVADPAERGTTPNLQHSLFREGAVEEACFGRGGGGGGGGGIIVVVGCFAQVCDFCFVFCF